ncbi:MAG TPA: CoA pyrophosphatase [Anaerolineales bacterium]|nr:CoA pyrophosphatase [Anaerolineales bacterium]
MITQSEIQSLLTSAYLPDVLESYIFPELRSKPAKMAGVIIPLTKRNDQWEILFTKRTNMVYSHKNQISFPGGAWEPMDSDLLETALRETNEEIGVPIPKENVLGKLNTRKTVSNYLVTSYVAALPTNYQVQPNPVEVEKVFSVPIDWLTDPINRIEGIHPDSKSHIYKFAPFEDEVIWGITAGILVDFLKVVNL